MMQVIKPIAVALNGKGPATLAKRFWSIGRRYGLSAAKMDYSLEQLSHLLQKFDSKATLPVTATSLARSSKVVQKYQAQGIEFAVHGYRHIDYSQLSQTEQAEHFYKAGQIFRENGIHYEGFRCPYLRSNVETLAALSENNFSYDSSPSLVWRVESRHVTESYDRVIDFYGAQPLLDYLALPYIDEATDLVRIPYCLPDDESLIERLIWESEAEMNQTWLLMAQHIHEQGELFTLGLHPERTLECYDALLATLKYIHQLGSSVWRASLSQIASWWRARYNTVVEVTKTQDAMLQLSINGPKGTTLLLRSLEVETATEPWVNGYQRANDIPCLIHTVKRPFIGVSSTSDPALYRFLKQQGYIVEITSDPASYSYYLDRASFSSLDERSLLSEIESINFPLARLGRWPYGAYSAFTVTGDVDALTLWDYSQRLLGK